MVGLDLIHPRDAIMRTMERVYRYRMTTTSGGNISVRDDDGTIWITPAAGRQGQPDARGHRPRPARRRRRGPPPPLLGAAVPPGHLRGPARPAGDRPRPPGGAGRLQHLPAACPTPGCCPRPGGSAARSASPPTPCPAARRWAGTSPQAFARGLRLRRAGEPRRGHRRRRPPGGVRAVRDAGVLRQDDHQGRPAGRGPVPGRRAGRAAAAVDDGPAGAPHGAGDAPRRRSCGGSSASSSAAATGSG